MDGDDQQAQQPEEDFSSAADLVRSMSGQAPSGDMVDMSRSLGFGSIGHIGKHSRSEQFASALEGYKKGIADAQRAQKPIHPEAQFYASVGDMSGAMAIQKSKGASLFTFGEQLDMGSAGEFMMTPSGKMQAVTEDGRRVMVDVADYAARSGVKTVPFRGGDQQAELFRNTLTRTKSLMDSLDELEKAYDDNSLYIGQFNPTENSAYAEQLETKVLLDAMSVLTGSKSLGGNTSNVDIDMLRKMMPKAASTYFFNTKGNEKRKLAELRKIVMNHVMSAAEANGIGLRAMKRQGEGPASISGISNSR